MISASHPRITTQGGTDEGPQFVVARGLVRGGAEPTGTAPSLHDDLAGPGPAVSRGPRGRRRPAPGGSRSAGRPDGEARAEVGPAVPEGSPGRVARPPRPRPQAGLFPPRSRCTW